MIDTTPAATADDPTRIAPDPWAGLPAPPRPQGRPPRRSVAWLVVGSALALGLLVASTYQFVDVMAHDERNLTWVVTEPVTTLVVDHGGDGSVHVIGAPVDEITMTLEVSDGLRPTAYDHRVVGDRLEVSASCPNFGSTWCSVDFLIEVPHGTVVRIRNDDTTRVENITAEVEVHSSGSVDVSGLTGTALLQTENGSIRATGLRSEVVNASSENGSVRISTDVAPRSVIATSDNGSVEVLVPRTGESYAVDVDSDHGSTTNEVASDPVSDRRITARSDNGSARVAYNAS